MGFCVYLVSYQFGHQRFFRLLKLLLALYSGGSRPSDKEGGGGHPDPEVRGRGLQKHFFRPFGPHFGLQIREDGPPGPLP